MVINKHINVYRVTYNGQMDETWFVMAYSVQEAIRTFMRYHSDDKDISEDNITGVVLDRSLVVLVDEDLLKNK